MIALHSAMISVVRSSTACHRITTQREVTDYRRRLSVGHALGRA
jgi:hypothetical protein